MRAKIGEITKNDTNAVAENFFVSFSVAEDSPRGSRRVKKNDTDDTKKRHFKRVKVFTGKKFLSDGKITDKRRRKMLNYSRKEGGVKMVKIAYSEMKWNKREIVDFIFNNAIKVDCKDGYIWVTTKGD